MSQEDGPRVNVEKGLPGINVRVTSSYRSGDDPWRGMVTIAYQQDDLMDIEGSLKDGRNGRWFAPPSREYEVNGQKKWKNLVWLHDKNLAGAISEAVEKFLSPGDAPVDDDDLPI